MLNRDLAPKGKVKNLRQKIEAFAKKHNLVINEQNASKIAWMENHKGRCFCDWQNRECPCDKVMQDLVKFNGRCLCRILFTKEALEKHQAKKPRISHKKTAAEKAADKQKQKKYMNLFNKLFKKKRKKM